MIFEQDSVHKELELTFDSGLKLTNANILANSTTFTESLCSLEDISFGSCEASSLSLEIINVDLTYKDLKNLWFNADLKVETQTIHLGKFKIVDSVKQGHSIKIEAMDKMCLFDENADEWFNSYDFKNKTLTNLFVDLCNKVGVTYNPTIKINGNLPINKTAHTTGYTYRDILSWIGEATGSFPHFDRNDSDKLKLYNLPNLSVINKTLAFYIPPFDFKDYKVQPVTKLQARTNENDVGVIVETSGTSGSGTNTYVIENNQLLVPFDATSLKPFLTNILNEISGLTYIPVDNLKTLGNPLIKLGDVIKVVAKDNTEVVIPVMNRVITGIISLTDTFSLGGSETREIVSTLNRSITQLNGKYLNIIKTVDGVKTELGSVSTDVVEIKKRVYVVSFSSQWGISTDKNTPPTNWTDTRPSVTGNQILWMREKYLYSDGSTKYDGERIISVDTGKELVDIKTEYAINDSSTQPPSSGWQSSIPAKGINQFLWRREVIYYNDNTTQIMTPYCVTSMIESDLNNALDNVKGTITQEYSTAIEIAKNTINSTVGSVTKVVDEHTQTITKLTTDAQQTDKNYQWVINQTTEITDKMSGLATKEEIAQMMTFENGILTINASNSEFSMQLSTSELGFYQGHNKVAWINNNELHITNAIMTKGIAVGTDTQRLDLKLEDTPTNGWSLM